MNIKMLSCFILLLAGAYAPKSTPSYNDEAQPWRNALQKITTLKKEKKTQEGIDLTKRKLSELLEASEKPGEKDSLIHYTNKILAMCHYLHIDAKQDKEGAAYLDSIGRNPFIQKHCLHELLSAQASLNQLYGNNPKAIRLADEYLKLPTCPDADEFIRQAEIISGVYVYSGNDLPKAIHILEKAVEAYHNGGSYQAMTRLISRLGIYYRLCGEYEKAVETNQEAILAYNDSIPPQYIVIAYGEQANLYAELEMYDRALQMNAKAQHYSMLQDNYGLGDLYRYRSEIFRQTGEKDSIFHYLRLGEQVSARQKSFKGVFVNKVNMASAYLLYPDSVQQALQLLQSISPDTTRMPQWAKYQFNLQMGQALLKTGKEAEGISLIRQAAQGFADMNMTETEYTTNKTLMDYYLSKGENDTFVHYYTRNQLFADSLNSNDKMRAVAAANIKFEAKQKEKENKLLSTQIQLQKQQLFYNICISVILLLLLVSTTAYFIIRRKANRQLIENNKREIQALITRQQDLNRRNEQLTEQIEQAMATNNINSIRQLTGQTLLSKEDENTFRRSFATLHPSYLPELRKHYPQLTRNEELLAMLICMNQSTDEIALIMGINRNSVNVVRSRMRKNMELSKEESLDEVLKRHLA